MTFFRSHFLIVFNYDINVIQLKHLKITIKDLSRVFYSKLNCHSHIEGACCKALKMFEFVELVCA